MLVRFERPKKDSNLTEYVAKMSEALDEIVEEKVDLSDVKQLISSLVKEQDENGFWALIPSPKVDGDIRVAYWYEPTYIATSIMIAYYMNHKSDSESIEGFTAALKKGLEASTGREFKGHGFDDIQGRLDALQIFSKCKVLKFIDECYGMFPKFSLMINAITNWLNTAIETGHTKGSWGEDYKDEMEKTFNLLISENNKINVFVYGTLMKEKRNHDRFLSDGKFKGNYIAEGFSLYDLGSYPGVIHCEKEKVKGELYEIDIDLLRELDMLEGEGSLYIRKCIKVVDVNDDLQNAYIYVYNHDVSNKSMVSFENQPWGSLKNSEYVWYAGYGSNLLYERFITYIKGGNCKYNGVNYRGCRNKLLPIDSKTITIPYRMYYANNSSSWSGAGVSFLDLERSGQTLGRMYLITREQFEEISKQEGRGEEWYNKQVVLGENNGVEIVTITNMRKRPTNKPSDKYLEVVSSGIKETYPDMSDFDIMKYLVDCGM